MRVVVAYFSGCCSFSFSPICRVCSYESLIQVKDIWCFLIGAPNTKECCRASINHVPEYTGSSFGTILSDLVRSGIDTRII